MVGYSSAAEPIVGADCGTTTSANITVELSNHSLQMSFVTLSEQEDGFCRGVVGLPVTCIESKKSLFMDRKTI